MDINVGICGNYTDRRFDCNSFYWTIRGKRRNKIRWESTEGIALNVQKKSAQISKYLLWIVYIVDITLLTCEQEVVSLEEDRDFSAFKTLYKELAPLLIFYAGKYVDQTTAEDLVQDVFLCIWQKQTPLLLKEGLKTYLYRSVRHACLDVLKHEEVKDNFVKQVTNRLKIEEIHYYEEAQWLYEEDERLIRIYEEMEKLPPKCREIFIMSYLEERKSDDIAILLNISKRTVEVQLYKALKLLRTSLLTCFIFHSSFFIFLLLA